MQAHDDDWDPDDEQPTVTCPYCKRAVPEDAAYCPYCENFISHEDAPASRKPWWIVIGTLACLYIVYRWIVP
jgi:predicted amidophosphoribosyltransferase